MLIARLLLISASVFAIFFNPAAAQPSGAEGDDFIYRVQSGDTLSELATQYTGNNANWRRLQGINSIEDPYALPIGKSLHIPFSMIPVSAAEATLTHQQGSPRINGYVAPVGYTFQEGDVIQTDERAFLTILLADNSTISVPPNSTLTVQRLKTFNGTGITDSILKLDQGSVETRVAPESEGVGRFEVHTPVSITGVRGTDLRVNAYENHTITEVLSGQAKFHAPSHTPQMVAANQGAAMDHSGHIVAQVSLLAAPAISEPARSASGGWEVHFPPVPQAVQYLAQVSLDEAGSQLVSRQYTTETSVRFQSSGKSGPHYLRVRAIDAHGIMGNDAIASFPGLPALRISDGTPVMTRFGIPVTLSEF